MAYYGDRSVPARVHTRHHANAQVVCDLSGITLVDFGFEHDVNQASQFRVITFVRFYFNLFLDNFIHHVANDVPVFVTGLL